MSSVNNLNNGQACSVEIPSSSRLPQFSYNPLAPVTCRFYVHGVCKYGVNCHFKHQDAAVTREAPASVIVQPHQQHEMQDSVQRIKSSGNSRIMSEEEWVNAPEFIPSASKSTGTTVVNTAASTKPHNYSESGACGVTKIDKLCPYAEAGEKCRYPPNECTYIHGDVCELCGNASLHPKDEEQRKRHQRECIRQHEKNMELSFAVARSREKSCGVCFEIILEKSSREQRFGILPNCNHCFCLSCIRKWRAAKQFDNKIIRACPECRVTSDFVCPSMYWVDTKEEKEKLITDYKGALKSKDCKYFKQGRGKCPFGNKCFYLHALADGTEVDVGPPVRHRRQAHDGDIDVLQQIIFWDFFDGRGDSRWLYSIDDLEDLVAFFSDSEDSDWSEYDFFFD